MNRKLPVPWMIGVVTFGILAMELALIRWSSSQIRIFAYFNNLVLIGAFLGMGVGVALGPRRPGLVHLALPLLTVLAVVFGFAEELGLVSLRFPDSTIVLWGGEVREADPLRFAANLGVMLAIYLVIIAFFVACGAPLGSLLARYPILRAYSADLLGSLAGVVAFSLLSWLELGPAYWLALGCLPFLFLLRRWTPLLLALVVVALGQYSQKQAVFSPYNRIEMSPMEEAFRSLRVEVNRDFHQYLHDLSDAARQDPSIGPEQAEMLRQLRRQYDLPFVLNPDRHRALIVGAGTGNDVQSALRHGYGEVVSVDIDGRIMEIGRESHPERPYQDPRVVPVVDDARAYFEKNPEARFSVVCYGLLDSHAMASAMSTLRLDNYVYTEEGIRAAWRLVAPSGHLSLSLSCYAGDWFYARLYYTIALATGKLPQTYYFPGHKAVTFVVGGPQATLDHAAAAGLAWPPPEFPPDIVQTTSDDWPFLYLRPWVIPWGYFVVLVFLLGLTASLVRPVFGVGRDGVGLDWPLFLMGAGFMLIEARGVTSLALLMGSTWVVNAFVFGGILLMVFLTNQAVLHRQFQNPFPWFAGLALAVLFLWAFPIGLLNALPLFPRGLLGGLITGLPVGLAGIIVPVLLARSPRPAAALGSNLLGAVLGGCLEYFSMIEGLRSTALLALLLYLLAALLEYRARRTRPLTA